MSKETIARQIKTIIDDVPDSREEAQLEYCQELVDRCLENKSSLIEMLSKHPNWDPENFRVHFDADYTRLVDRDVAVSSVHAMTYILLRRLPGEYSSLKNLADWINDRPSWFCNNDTVSEELEKYVKNYFPDAHIHTGAKITRALMKLLRQYGFEDIDPELKHEALKYYSAYTDALNPIKITRHTVLSVNPADFLLMSNGNSWHSCHYVWHEDSSSGCYRAGCESYAYDRVTMIFYTVGADTSVDELTFGGKETRQLFFWNGWALVGSRLYPQNFDSIGEDAPEKKEIRTIVEQIISDCLGVANMWRLTPDDGSWDYYTRGYHYPDYRHWRFKARELTYMEGQRNLAFHIGSDDAICVCCGNRLDDESYPVCRECAGSSEGDTRCEDCGAYGWEDDMYYISDEDRWVCSSCYNYGDYGYCEDCGRYFSRDYLRYVESVDRDVCDSCLEDSFTYCDCCEDYVPNDDAHCVHHYYKWGDGYVCDYCLDNNPELFFCCEDCDEWFARQNETEHFDEDGNSICDECWEANHVEESEAA